MANANNSDVKKYNRRRIFRFINSNQQTCKPDIAKQLSLSMPTVLQIVNELIAEGLVEEVGELASNGGRKAIAISSQRASFYCLGIDITQNHIGIVATDLAGEVLMHQRNQATYFHKPTYYQQLAKDLEAFISHNAIDRTKVIGVGISIPGIVDKQRKKIVYSHALGIEHVDFHHFTKEISYPCYLINDANAAAIAEIFHASLHEDIVYLSLSNSVGGAIIKKSPDASPNQHIQELLYLGINGRAGEFGHMTHIIEGETCYCGKKGCLDSYINAKNLASLTHNQLNDFFLQLPENDQFKLIWTVYLKHLSIAINNLRMIFDCPIVLGGYVGSYIEPYLDILSQHLNDRNTFSHEGDYIRACKYKIEASALGAALCILDSFIENI